MRGKNINMFLMDGTSTGRIKCTIANWTGVAYKIPRTELERCKNRDDLKQSGVYFLFGESTVISGKQAIAKTVKEFCIVCLNINVTPKKIIGTKP